MIPNYVTWAHFLCVLSRNLQVSVAFTIVFLKFHVVYLNGFLNIKTCNFLYEKRSIITCCIIIQLQRIRIEPNFLHISHNFCCFMFWIKLIHYIELIHSNIVKNCEKRIKKLFYHKYKLYVTNYVLTKNDRNVLCFVKF